MKTQTTIQNKLADWTSAFNSISNKQSEKAQVLSGLITGLRTKVGVE